MTDDKHFRLRTRWKRAHPGDLIGKRFFDRGNYSLGYFTFLKVYRCKVYCKAAETPDGSHWFDKRMAVIKTDAGLTYRVPFFPWANVEEADGDHRELSELYSKHPW